jgi:hypothetical protein
MDAFDKWASTYDWFGELEPNPTTDSLALSFTNRLTETIHRIFPQKKVTRHRNTNLGSLRPLNNLSLIAKKLSIAKTYPRGNL